MEFTKEQLAIVRNHLAQIRERADISREEWWESYQSWARGDRTWRAVYGFGGTDIHTALWWFQYRHKPGSKEWRPIVILRALLKASERDYAEPERLPADDAALQSDNNARSRATIAFKLKYGVKAYHSKIRPILRRGGVKALFLEPATAETRAYVEILAKIASREVI